MTDRFWSKVDAKGPCWQWTGALNGGYGRFRPGGSAPKQMAHRVAWEMLVGPIPEGMQLDHLCRNRGCVNPDHLEPVTAKENMRRGHRNSHERMRTHCPRGHHYDKMNTRVNNGMRQCRACDRERYREKVNLDPALYRIIDSE